MWLINIYLYFCFKSEYVGYITYFIYMNQSWRRLNLMYIYLVLP